MVQAASSARAIRDNPSASAGAWANVGARRRKVGVTRGAADPGQHAARDAHVADVCASLASLVRKVAYRFARRLPAHVELDDLVGAGSLGLVMAVRQHLDKPRGELERLVVQRVRGAMLDHLRGADPLTRRQRAAVGAVQRARAALERDGQKADLEEVAGSIGMSMRRAEQIERRLLSVQITPLTSPESVIDHSDLIERLQQRDRQEKVTKALAMIPERLQILLSLYYYEELTYQEISEVLAISRSRVCQLHAQALEALRRSLTLDRQDL
jgi:RNA polymerase sigma factor FliA